MPVPDRERARRLLERHWAAVVGERAALGVDEATAAQIATLISSETVSFTYSLPTQLLGKLTDHGVDALCLQSGEGEPWQWDPRSFATGVIVPWVRDNENVLGNSADPYVSNPLRQPRILPNPPNVRSNTLSLWESLHSVLSEVQRRDDPAYTEAVFLAVLLAIYGKLKEQQFDYPALRRASSEHVAGLVRGILESSQAGEHAMSVVAALFTVIGHRFALWDNVHREESTTADQATGMAGDIECRWQGRLVYAAEVKERQITVADLRSFEDKLNRNNLIEGMICAPGARRQQESEIEGRLRSTWGRGISLHCHSVENLVGVLTSLLGEDGRVEFIVQVGRPLDAHARLSGRLAWRNLLLRLLDGT